MNTAKVNDTYSSDEEDILNSGLGERSKRDQFIVMDDVSGLADKSKRFASFLIVAHKLIIHVSTFFTLSIQKNHYGEQFFCKRISLIFFEQVFH